MKRLFVALFIPFFMITQGCMIKDVTTNTSPGAADYQNQNSAKWIKMGSDLFKEGLYQHAIEALSNAIELNPQEASAYLLRGTAYFKLRQYNPTINDFNKAIELNPQDATGYYCRGLAYDSLGNSNQAIQDMKKAAKQNFKLAQEFLLNKKIEW